MKSTTSQNYKTEHNQRDRELNWWRIVVFNHFRQTTDTHSPPHDSRQNESQSKDTSEDALKTVVAEHRPSRLQNLQSAV